MEILSGKQICEEKLFKIKNEVNELICQGMTRPKVVFIKFIMDNFLVDKSFELHVKTAEEVGFEVIEKTLPQNISEETFVEVIENYNKDHSVTAIMFLMPLPKQISYKRAFNSIDYSKEIEGLHPDNAKFIFPIQEGNSPIKMVVPKTIRTLLEGQNIDIENKRIVCIIDQKFEKENPVADMVCKFGCMAVIPPTSVISIVNTENLFLKELAKEADILIVSSEQSEFLDSSYVKTDAVIIDFYAIFEGFIDGDQGKKIPVIKGSVDIASLQDTDVKLFKSIGGAGPVMISILMENILNTHKFYLDVSMSVSRLSIRIDGDLKDEAKEVYKDMGMDLTTAVMDQSQ